MPRGFLVKRSRRAPYGASYRAREDEHHVHEQTSAATATAHLGARAPEDGSCAPAARGQHEERQQLLHEHELSDPVPPPHHPHPNLPPPPPPQHPVLPHRPHHPHPQQQLFPLSASSVARALLLQQQHLPHPPHPPALHPPRPQSHVETRDRLGSARSRKKPTRVSRKPHAALSAEEEESTSPVLGLEILRREEKDSRSHAPGRGSAGSGGARPLREFICQLCKEEYADPFALAQHRCSRIVRVEYRCPECSKVFSCPANLASHRRWHRPRDTQQLHSTKHHNTKHLPERAHTTTITEQRERAHITITHSRTEQEEEEEEGKENARSGGMKKRRPAPPGEEEEEEDVEEDCYCSSRTFHALEFTREHTHLRKHLTAGTTPPTLPPRPTPAPGSGQAGRGRLTCGLCGGRPRATSTGGAPRGAAGGGALWAGSGPAGLGLGVGGLTVGGGVEFCPSLYSAHGLSAHLSRCHTAESARAAMMHVPPARPVC